MSLSKRLEEAKGAKESEAEALLRQEEEKATEAKKAEETSFLNDVAKQKSLASALEGYQQSVGQVTSAQTERRAKANKITGLIDELKEVNPDAPVPTAREIFRTPEEDFTPDDPEAQYKDASETLKGARNSRKEAAQELRSLGIDAEGKTDEELAVEVERVRKETEQKVREYVKAHQESELPEAQEVRAQMVEEKVIAMSDLRSLNKDRLGESATKALGEALVLTERDRDFLLFSDRENTKPRSAEDTKDRVKDMLRRGALNFFKAKDSLGSYIKEANSLRLENDGMGREALTTFIRMQMTGGNLTSLNENRIHLYGSRSFSRNAYNGIALMLGYKDPQEIPDSLFYDDNSGFSPEGTRALAEAFPPETLIFVVEKILKAAAAERELESIPTERQAAERRKTEVDARLREISSELNRLESGNYADQNIAREETRKSALEQLPSQLRILLQGKNYGKIRISEASFGNTVSIGLESFGNEINTLSDRIVERRKALEKARDDAKAVWETAKSAKRGFFNKKQLDADQAAAYAVYSAAHEVVENPSTDSEYRSINESMTAKRDEYRREAKAIEDLLGTEGRNMTQIGELPQENFITRLSDTATELAASAGSEAERLRGAVAEREAAKNVLREEQSSLTSELEKIKKQLDREGHWSESFIRREKDLRYQIDELQKDVVGRF